MKKLSVVVDMYGCPNRCKHCWLGSLETKDMPIEADEIIINYFKPYFNEIAYYSWLREPDFSNNYKERWKKDLEISINTKPERFELASFFRLVRDPGYPSFLRNVGTNTVQLTLFGLEELTDKYIGRKNAFKEIIFATNKLLENGIGVRWQAFINQENKEEIVKLLFLIEEMDLKNRSEVIGIPFKFFVHAGSCEGGNFELYHLRINKNEIPNELIPYYLDYEKNKSEKELYFELINDSGFIEFFEEDHLVLNINSSFDVFFNYTNIDDAWKIGNILQENSNEILKKIKHKDVFAINESKRITIGELVKRYGDKNSQKTFSADDYKDYLFLKHLRYKKMQKELIMSD